MPEDSTAQPLKEAVNGLERIYAVLSGFALTNGLKNISTEWLKTPNNSFPINHALVFVGLLVTIIPFSHGAWQHLTLFHLNRKDSRSTARVFLFDYTMLLVEGLLFVMMAFATANFDRFIELMLALIIVDMVFVVGTGIALQRRNRFHRTVFWWGVLDVMTILLGVFLWSHYRTPIVAAIFLIIRTAIDYMANWSFYFPSKA